MNVALLCPGPSHRITYPGHKADLVLAVNRTAIEYAADWWCILDFPLLAMVPAVAARPQIFTSRNTRDSLARAGSGWAKRVGTLADDLDCPVQSWALYTANAALVLAAHLGARRIDAFGVDWTGQADADGVLVEGCNRTPERWACEVPIWDKLVYWLASRGVQVNRIRLP